MRNNRLFLCLLLGVAIIFYGVPYLNFFGDMKTVIFSVAWLLFALMAISGNLIALLYRKRISKNETIRQNLVTQRKQKVRHYG
ncbi:hypothetical protein RJD24_16555 [Bacillaceae bacterium IKA-2]|jgi:membrane protein implicated in regulation of membrane protease activity|nr:hypothetical protein RJD24_16555 [Bacillaceae bacterium IKA-2]